MSRKIQTWLTFAVRVRNHIRDYVINQYGEDGNDPATEYTPEDCIKHAQRYLARFGKQSRQGEELLDLYKAAHWIQIAHDKIAGFSPLLTVDEAVIEEAERDFANAPMSITEIKSEKVNNGSIWTVRDALIAALRDLDSGKLKASLCVLCFGDVDDKGRCETMSYQRTNNRYEYWGLMTEVMNRRTIRDAQE